MRMKRTTVLLLSFLLIWTACHRPSGSRIEGKILGLNKGTVYLKIFDTDSTTRAVDSVHIKGDPSFTFDLDGLEPQLMVLEVKEKPGDYLLFFSDDTVMHIYTQLDKFGVAKRLEGGPNLRHWQAYKDMLVQYNNQKLELTKQGYEAYRRKDTAAIHRINRELYSVEKRRKLYAMNFALTPPFIPVKAYVAYTELQNNPQALDTIYKAWPQDLRQSLYGKKIDSLLSAKR